jgi:NADPH:quinone reductase
MSIACTRELPKLDILTAPIALHAGLFAGLDNDTLRPIVGKELPLAEAARAHKEILEGGSAGKIVLVC